VRHFNNCQLVRRRTLTVGLVWLAGFGALWACHVPSAAAASPWWHLTSGVRPSQIPAGGEATVVVEATNVGDAPTIGPVTLSDVLPAGASVVEKEGAPEVGLFMFSGERGLDNFGSLCAVVANRVTCTIPEEVANPEEGGLPISSVVKPYENIEIRIAVKVGATTEDHDAEVSGGGAATIALTHPLPVDEAPPAFGGERYELVPEEEGGAVDARAGSHPFQLTTNFALNQTANPLEPPALPKDLQFKLPPGLVGNATTMPQCSDLDFKKILNFQNLCPSDTAVGVATVTFDEPKTRLRSWPFPLFNLVPEEGEPARFGFTVLKTPVTLDTSVRTGSDYGVTVNVSNLSEVVGLLSSSVTFWGVPGSHSHDESRGWQCLAGAIYESRGEPCTPSDQSTPPPFLTMPTSCALPFSTSAQGDSWPRRVEPSGEPVVSSFSGLEYSLTDEFGRSLGIIGCNQLPFSPAIEAVPDRAAASTPTGMKINVHIPQEVNENAEGLASSAVKGIAVTFPDGVMVNPASAGGLEACSESQIGFTGVEAGSETDLFTPGLPLCPAASKLGTVKIKVPILAHPLEGALYLAAQNANPFGSLIAAYLVAEDPISGVRVKLAGEVTLNHETGQITATFRNSPQAPLEDAEIHLFDGPRAPFSSPSRCGSYTTTATFTPWSETEPVHSSSTFDTTSGPNGGPCPDTLPFNPSVGSSVANADGGAFTSLTTTVSRGDGEQSLQSVQLHYPPGVSGILKGVKLCLEAQANAGTCGQESLIGHAVASVGLGDEPFTVTGGEVFLTEAFKGASFGLSIVMPAVAGPFNLGKVVVRARVDVDPHTAALTITTEPIPHILEGIPLQIKHVTVTIDRPDFTFNPTSCNAMSITGLISSVEGTSSPVSAPLQAVNCATLKFAPKFSASTTGKTSKANGASLIAKVTYPHSSLGTQANIKSVKVDLPKSLPSRLTTLQRACTAAAFASNPASCPPESVVGHAIVHTQVLPVPLEGPAYFVSHGGEAFPNLIIVLQGDNVTVELVGNTDIKHGVTSSTFASTPDVPFESFELALPQGKHSALAANGNLCHQDLVMPTAFVGQSGATLNQNTHIKVEGCSRTLSVVSKHVRKKILKLSVYAPGAGRVVATGKGVSFGSKAYSSTEAHTFTLTQKRRGKLQTKIRLKYAASTGKHQSKTITVTFKQ
jgi:hypothetical protein